MQIRVMPMIKYHVMCEVCRYHVWRPDTRSAMIKQTRHSTVTGHHVMVYKMRDKPTFHLKIP